MKQRLRITLRIVAIVALASEPGILAAQRTDGPPAAAVLMHMVNEALGEPPSSAFVLREAGVQLWEGQGRGLDSTVRMRTIQRSESWSSGVADFVREVHIWRGATEEVCERFEADGTQARRINCVTNRATNTGMMSQEWLIRVATSRYVHGLVEAFSASDDSPVAAVWEGRPGWRIRGTLRGQDAELVIDSASSLPKAVTTVDNTLGKDSLVAWRFGPYLEVGEFRYPESQVFYRGRGIYEHLAVVELVSAGGEVATRVGSSSVFEVRDQVLSRLEVLRLAESVLLFHDVAPSYNVLVLRDGRSAVVIDPVLSDSVSSIVRDSLIDGYGVHSVSIVMTHFHSDHVSGIQAFGDRISSVVAPPQLASRSADLFARFAGPEVLPVVDSLNLDGAFGGAVVYLLKGVEHVDELLLVFISDPGLLLVPDLVWTDQEGSVRYEPEELEILLQFIQRRRLVVKGIVTSHGQLVDMSELSR